MENNSSFIYTTSEPALLQKIKGLYWLTPKSRRLKEIKVEDGKISIAVMSGQEFCAPIEECSFKYGIDSADRMEIYVNAQDKKIHFTEIPGMLAEDDWMHIRSFVTENCKAEELASAKVLSIVQKISDPIGTVVEFAIDVFTKPGSIKKKVAVALCAVLGVCFFVFKDFKETEKMSCEIVTEYLQENADSLKCEEVVLGESTKEGNSLIYYDAKVILNNQQELNIVVTVVDDSILVKMDKMYQVKTGKFSGYSTTTIGKAFDASFGNVEWSGGTSPKGEEFVEFSGDVDIDFLDLLADAIYENVGSDLGNPLATYNAMDACLGKTFANRYRRQMAGLEVDVYFSTLGLGNNKMMLQNPEFKTGVKSDFVYALNSMPKRLTVQFVFTDDGSGFELGYYGFEDEKWSDCNIQEIVSQENFLNFVYSNHVWSIFDYESIAKDIANHVEDIDLLPTLIKEKTADYSKTKAQMIANTIYANPMIKEMKKLRDLLSRQNGSMTDSRDGSTYKTVTINNKTWMAENLNYKTMNSRCYKDSTKYCDKYGRLYTWYDAEKVCPTGWHLPTDNEYQSLLASFGKNNVAGKMLKSTQGWFENGNGLNASGFSAYPAGTLVHGNYDTEGFYTGFWSFTEFERDNAILMEIMYNKDSVSRVYASKNSLYSIRCVKGDIMIDSRDGQTYRTVPIGTQVWMAENLNFETENSLCYQDKATNCTKYGRLYTWKEAKNVCPIGWHLPSKAEFETLVAAVGGSKEAGKKLKSTSGWEKGMDTYGFSALPAGRRVRWANYYYIEDTGFWTSSEHNGYGFPAYSLRLEKYSDYVSIVTESDDASLSVRCVKD